MLQVQRKARPPFVLNVAAGTSWQEKVGPEQGSSAQPSTSAHASSLALPLSLVNVPLGHGMQSVAAARPEALLYLPAAHAMQSLACLCLPAADLSSGLYRPAGHPGQSALLPVSVDILPLLHSWQSVDAPAVALYLPAMHAVHNASPLLLAYFPAAHATHETAPVPEPAFVMLPTAHEAHCAFDPGEVAYFPVAHGLHETFEFGEDFPETQEVHFVAPTPVSLSVKLPAAHDLHATFESAENWPATQLEQDCAPASLSLSVMLPAAQVAHACFESAEKVPAAHFVHDFAPVLPSSSVTLPAAHGTHTVAPAEEYLPAAHASEQAVFLPVEAEYLPGAHFVQSSAVLCLSASAAPLPALLYRPLGQSAQALISSTRTTLPAAQTGQEVCPGEAENVPRPHAMHFASPLLPAYFPAAHAAHETAPLPAPVLVMLPALHLDLSATPPRQTYPFGHALQELFASPLAAV